ncbi:MAG: hypothetical protein QM487_04070 [Candidatus Marithrix sp.]
MKNKFRIYSLIMLVICLFGVKPTLASSAEQVIVPTKSVQIINEKPKKELSLFFIIGIIINLVMLSAFIIWAIIEWKKTD